MDLKQACRPQEFTVPLQGSSFQLLILPLSEAEEDPIQGSIISSRNGAAEVLGASWKRCLLLLAHSTLVLGFSTPGRLRPCFHPCQCPGALSSLLQHKVTKEPLPGTETSSLKELGDLKKLRDSWTEDSHEPGFQLGWKSVN